MDGPYFLLSYGNVGDFGRFGSSEPLSCRRGDRVVVRSHRGQEVGVVLGPANDRHSHLLADRFVGEILRPVTEGDRQLAERMRQRSRLLFEEARGLIGQLAFPLEIVDAEVLLDGRLAVVHYLRWEECDPRPLMDQLSQRFRLLVTMHDLALPAADRGVEEHPEHGCGSATCGSTGGCGSCASGRCSSCGANRHPGEPASLVDQHSQLAASRVSLV